MKRTDSQNQTYTYQYDKRGNRIAETGKKESRAFVYDETNHLVEGTNWKGDKSAYTYNALFVRINNTQTSHSGSVYSRDYVIDYTSLERDDLMIYAEGDGQLDYVQREVYAGSERIEQFTDRSNGGYERTLYVHEDVQGNTRYYTKTNGNSFAELTYDAWGMPVSPNKLLNNDHGNYVYATYTGHIFDTTLDIYFAEARFYDAQTRTWLAMDPIKDGGNWYQYCFSNPLRYWDPTGLIPVAAAQQNGFSQYGGCQGISYAARWQDPNSQLTVLFSAPITEFLNHPIVRGTLETIWGFGAAAVAATVFAGAVTGAIAAGPATVIVIAAGSFLSTAFATSDAVEGAATIYEWATGTTVNGKNAMRDTIFDGNTFLYSMVRIPADMITAFGYKLSTLYPSPSESKPHEIRMPSNPDSRVLRQNLLDSGEIAPSYPNAAHHIVAGNAPRADKARFILRKYGIDINDASNGVFLPTVKGVSEATYHHSMHTRTYYDAVNEILRNANSREEVIYYLNYIAERLKNGTFPK